MSPEHAPPQSPTAWTTADLGLAAYLAALGLSVTITMPDGNGGLSRFVINNGERLEALVLSWGRGGQVEAARYWQALAELKARIREVRRQAALGARPGVVS
jgi:hypothetical protein